MLGLCFYAGSGRVFICKCMQKKKEMATKSFVMQFISAIKQKEKKGELNIANGGICDSFSIHTAILLPPRPRIVLLPSGFSGNGSPFST